MLDLSSLDQPSDQSWADMVDEELDNVRSDDDKSTSTPSSEHTPSHANGARASNASAVESKPARDEQSKEEKEKQADSSSGVVWRIPDAKQRQEQKSVLQMLIERRKNLDKLNDEKQQQQQQPQQDRRRESYKRDQRRDMEERRQQSPAGRSDSVDSWRRPIGKYERIPVRPLEENKISQWASYSATLQKEFKEEQEEAQREFIRRFGSKAANDRMDGSNSSNGSSSPKAATSTPIEIKISADGPSDWADDFPSDDEWPVHNDDNDDDDDNNNMESDRTTTKDDENVIVDEMQKTRLEDEPSPFVDESKISNAPTAAAVPVENNITNDASAPEHDATPRSEEKDIDQKQQQQQQPEEVSMGWQAFAENGTKPTENKKQEEGQHQPNDTSTSNDIDQKQQQRPEEVSMGWQAFAENGTKPAENKKEEEEQRQPNDTSTSSDIDQQPPPPPRSTVHELPGQLKWAAFAHEESQKKTMKAPIIHASPSVSSGTSASYSSRDPPQTPDDGTQAHSPSCSTSTTNSDKQPPSSLSLSSSPPQPTRRSPSPLKKKTPLPARSARSQIMGHLLKNERKPRPLATTENKVAQQLQQPAMVEFKERQTHVERVHSSTLETSSVTSDHATASVATSNSHHSTTTADHSTSKPININNDRAANSWQLFAQEHDTTAEMHRSPRSYR